MTTSEKKKGRLEALERRLLAGTPTPQAQGQATLKTTSVSSDSSSVLRTLQDAKTPAEIAEREKTYAQLCPSVVNGPLCSLLKLSRGKDPIRAINEVLKNLLEGNSKLQGDVDSLLENRIQENQMLMLDNPSQNQLPGSEKARERAHKNRGKRSRQHLSLRQHRKCGSYDLPQEFRELVLFCLRRPILSNSLSFPSGTGPRLWNFLAIRVILFVLSILLVFLLLLLAAFCCLFSIVLQSYLDFECSFMSDLISVPNFY